MSNCNSSNFQYRLTSCLFLVTGGIKFKEFVEVNHWGNGVYIQVKLEKTLVKVYFNSMWLFQENSALKSILIYKEAFSIDACFRKRYFCHEPDQLVIITFNTLYSKTQINRIYRPFFLNKLQQFLSFFQGPLLKFLLGQKPFLPELCWPGYEVWCSFRLPENPEVYYNLSFNKGAYIQNVICSNWCLSINLICIVKLLSQLSWETKCSHVVVLRAPSITPWA